MKASPAAVHISLALGVVLYTLLGALIMQRLESSEKSGAVGRTTASEEGSQVPSPVKVKDLGGSTPNPAVYECLEHVVKGIMAKTKCMKREPDELSISDIDKCYESATIESDVFDKKRSEHLGVQPENGHLVSDEVGEEGDKWSFGNSLIFTFSIVTTIGYGHIAPETFSGRIFCIIFGLIGVPLTLIEIANLGMFISVVLGRVAGAISSIVLFFANCSWNKVKLKLSRRKERALITVTDSEEDNNSKEIDISETRRTGDAVILGLTFVCYLVLGALVLPGYEPEMDFFTALYFNFVTLTTMGLGDVVPKRFDYLFLTLCYIGIGLALTTMAINLAADILRKLHYFGRKMGNMAAAVVWFGGKKMTVGKLIKHFGDQFNIPEEDTANLDVNNFIESSMKVEAGQLKTLRKPLEKGTVSFSKLRKSKASIIYYVDDRESRRNGLSVVPEKSDEALKNLSPNEAIPLLELDYSSISDRSLPSSLNDEFLKKNPAGKRA